MSVSVVTYETYSAVKDGKENIDFSEKAPSSKLCTRFVALTKNSLRKGISELMEIEGAVDSLKTEALTDLKVGENGEIYIKTYDLLSFGIRIKILCDHELTTIFPSESNPSNFTTGQIVIRTVKFIAFAEKVAVVDKVDVMHYDHKFREYFIILHFLKNSQN